MSVGLEHYRRRTSWKPEPPTGVRLGRPMSTLSSDSEKGTASKEPDKTRMTYCGEYDIRAGNTETHGKDGINGTIVAPQSKVNAAGAGPKEKVRLLIETDEKSATITREIHSSGNTLTIPLDVRQNLDLEPGDTIEFWIDSVIETQSDEDSTEDTKTVQKSLDKDSEEDSDEFIAIIGNSLTYHLTDSKNASETICGISLETEEVRLGENPGDVLDPCDDCRARSAKPMTAEEIVNWLSKEMGFKKSEEQPQRFDKEQLSAIRDGYVELKEKNKEAETKLREFRGRVARLEQRIQKLEG